MVRGKKTEWELKRQAYAAQEKAAGRPMRVPYGPAMEHRDKLRALGMTDVAIAAAATDNGYPMHQSTVSCIGRKGLSNIHRDTEAGILSISLDEAEECPHKLVPAVGARRILGGLILKGYSLAWLSEHGGIYEDPSGNRGANRSYAHNIMSDTKRLKYVELRTFRRMYRVAQKLDMSDPADLGVKAQVISRAKRYAAKHGFVPLKCWDEDTILDPDAYPEWTGACGTEEGYRIHLRESLSGNRLPLCTPCREAVETRVLKTPYSLPFKWQRMVELVQEQDISYVQLAEFTGISTHSIYRWKTGEYAPRYRGHVEAIAAALDVDVEELLGEEEEPEVTVAPLVDSGEFNRHALKVILDMAGMSQAKAADITGVAHTAMNKWIAGQAKPVEESKAKLEKLADHLGVDVEVFYA